MTRLEQATQARLAEIRDIARSGQTELTGKHAVTRMGESDEFHSRHFGGMRSAFPELSRLPDRDTPKKMAAAIDRGKGKVYRRVHDAVQRSLSTQFAKPRTPEKPTVPAHRRLTRKCKTCGKLHGKSQHRFHGEGAMARTHLFSFNPKFVEEISPELRVKMLDRRRSAFARKMKQIAADVRSPYASTARILLMRPVSRWTRQDLEEANRLTGVYQPIGPARINRRRRAKSNPGRVVIYGRLLRIEAQKTQPHVCDAGCKRVGHRYFHDFKPGAVIYGLQNGDLLIQNRH